MGSLISLLLRLACWAYVVCYLCSCNGCTTGQLSRAADVLDATASGADAVAPVVATTAGPSGAVLIGVIAAAAAAAAATLRHRQSRKTAHERAKIRGSQARKKETS